MRCGHSRGVKVDVDWSDEKGREFTVTCTVIPGSPGKLYGPPEKCYPPEPGEVEVVKVIDKDGVEHPELSDKVDVDEEAVGAASDYIQGCEDDAAEARAEVRRGRDEAFRRCS